MPRTLVPLTDSQLAALATALTERPGAPITILARELAAPYFTVHKAAARLRGPDGWHCPLAWSVCTECDRPVSGPVGHGRRTAHTACEGARAARYQRGYRVLRPGQSTPHVRAWRGRNPARLAEMREAEKARLRAQWPALPPEEQSALLARAHAADERDQDATRLTADNRGAPWGRDEDEYLIEHPRMAARDAALELGRTLWAVRGRRVLLRRRGLLPPVRRP